MHNLAAYGTSPWCGAFTESELLDFEHELDVLMCNLLGDMGPVLGGLFMKKLAER